MPFPRYYSRYLFRSWSAFWRSVWHLLIHVFIISIIITFLYINAPWVCGFKLAENYHNFCDFKPNVAFPVSAVRILHKSISQDIKSLCWFILTVSLLPQYFGLGIRSGVLCLLKGCIVQKWKVIACYGKIMDFSMILSALNAAARIICSTWCAIKIGCLMNRQNLILLHV